MLDILRRAFGLNPQSSGGRDGDVPEARYWPNPNVEQGMAREQRMREQEALARARGYPSVEAFYAAEPDMLPDYIPPHQTLIPMYSPDGSGQRVFVPESSQRGIHPEDIAAGIETLEPVLGGSLSRLIGGALSGNSLADMLSDPYYANSPELREVLSEKGLPEWAATVVDALTIPDPLGAGKLHDLFLLTSLIPGFRGLRGLGGELGEAAERFGRDSPEFAEAILNRGGGLLPEDLRGLPPELGPDEMRQVAGEIRDTFDRGVASGYVRAGDTMAARAYADRLDAYADVLEYQRQARVVPMPEASNPSLAALEGMGRNGAIIPQDDLLTRLNVLNRLVQSQDNLALEGPTPDELESWLYAVAALGDEVGLAAAKYADSLMGFMGVGQHGDIPDYLAIRRAIRMERDAVQTAVLARGLRGISQGDDLTDRQLAGVVGRGEDGLTKADVHLRDMLEKATTDYEGMLSGAEAPMLGPAFRYIEDAFGMLDEARESAAALRRNVGEGFTEAFGNTARITGETLRTEGLDSFYDAFGLDRETFKRYLDSGGVETLDRFLADLGLDADARQMVIADLDSPVLRPAAEGAAAISQPRVDSWWSAFDDETDAMRLREDFHDSPRSQSARFRGVVPLSEVIDLPGARDEHVRFLGNAEEQARIDELAEAMRRDGFDPDHPIMIWVEQDGKPVIAEGNHRVRAAMQAGIENIPVDIRYFGGSDFGPGAWRPQVLRDHLGESSFTIPISPEDRNAWREIHEAAQEAHRVENWTPVELMDALEEKWGAGALDGMFTSIPKDSLLRTITEELRVMGMSFDDAHRKAQEIYRELGGS